ncbi:MAG: alkaline phosphatase [Cyanobacteria bacterium QS_8_48_54]|nr:MAG: alkaline phosphatase [Cyanobacteria bacterium QS_8_48_54]
MNYLHLNCLLSTRLRRRGFLIGGGALTGLAIASQWQRVVAQPKFSDNPFKLGVASGDPLPDSVVLWTRLAPEPLTEGGGMPRQPVPVQWQVATDNNMSNVVQRGTVMATPELTHSVHAEVGGLEPNRWYWYQFKVGSELSPIGRTRTAPLPGNRLNRFRFALASCQSWASGYYPAYRDMAEDDLDLVVHVGDYIYESPIPEDSGMRSEKVPERVRPEPMTLEEYRLRHALYKLDPDLQAAHASLPWIVTWDDHEVENNYADDIPQEGSQQEVFLRRRANAYQAYYEHMPLRSVSKPEGPNMKLFRRFTFGNLAEFSVLDTRQYRSDQVCPEGFPSSSACPARLDPSRTMTGAEQERWLLDGLDRSQVTWNAIANQTIFAQYDYAPGSEQQFNRDQWDGYAANRQRILDFLAQRQPSNPVVITGDWHSSWVNDLKQNFDNPNSPTVGTEFVCSGISSGISWDEEVERALSENPHVKFFDGKFRGYVRCELTQQQWRSDIRVVENSSQSGVPAANLPVRTLASFVVENGQPGPQRI